MATFFVHLFEYLAISFALGALWHVVLFKNYYKKPPYIPTLKNHYLRLGFRRCSFRVSCLLMSTP